MYCKLLSLTEIEMEIEMQDDNKDIAIFKVPSGDDDYNKAWRDKIVAIITRDREINPGLKRQIEAKTLHVCELHYPEESLIRNGNKTTRIPGTLPTLNLPVKPFTVFKTERSTSSIEKRVVAYAAVTPENNVCAECYKSFEDFNNRVMKLKLPVGWDIKVNTTTQLTSIKYMDSEFVIPKYQIFVKNDLSFNLLIYNWEVKSNTICSMKFKTLSTLIKEINQAHICKGVDFVSDNLIKHTVPKLFSPTTVSKPLEQVEYRRPSNCLVLYEKGYKCKICHEKELQNHRQLKKKAQKSVEPAKLNALISLTSPERVKLSMQNYRIENKHLTEEIKRLQKIIADSAVPASNTLDGDLKSIMSNADPSKVSPFMKFF